MDRGRWQRIEQLYYAALEMPAEARSAFLAQQCNADPDLRREVEELLAQDEIASSLVDRPAWERGAGMIDAPELTRGTLLGPYRIECLLGRGGMASVYRAEDTRLGRSVAIKIVAGAGTAASMRRFQREAEAISALNHPHICALYDIGTIGDTSYLVMEHVEGSTIAELLRDGALPPHRAVAIAADIADGLAAAHARGIVHRDLKPANVMVTQTGARILDFGLSKAITKDSIGHDATLTLEGTVMGTPAYMAPEQFAGGSVDGRADIFALGVVLYEMVTGRRAFSGDTLPEIIAAILKTTPPPPRSINPAVPSGLERILARCLDKAPENRYQSAKELERDLRNIDATSSRRGPAATRRWLVVAVIIIAIVALALTVRLTMRVRSPAIQSIAVLPLDNLSGDSAQEYFADGMTEVLITDLGQIGSLRVISRPAVMKYKHSQAPLRNIAGELNVDALIVGSVARAEGKVRITTQLYEASKDRQLWAESYERDMRDVIALQREVAHAITNEISIKVTPQETARLAKSRQVDPEAYDGYLRGVLQYARHTNADNQAAISTMERAIAIDPNFAAGQALLGLAYVERLFTFAPQDQKELEEKAFVAVEKAVSLDADEAMAYFARGRLLWTPSNHFPHESAIREYRRSLALNPNLAEARAQLALTYNHIGLLDKALREARISADINPVDALPRVVIGQALLYSGDYDRALNVWSSNPPDAYSSVTGSHTAWTLFQMGRVKDASARLSDFLVRYPNDVGGLGVQAVLLAAAGRNADAERVIRGISGQKGFGHFHHTAYYIACAYARMNRADQALQWVREAAETGFACYPLFERDPNLRVLHGDPRWPALMLELRRNWERYDKLTSGDTYKRTDDSKRVRNPQPAISREVCCAAVTGEPHFRIRTSAL
jgi:TolB-like protein